MSSLERGGTHCPTAAVANPPKVVTPAARSTARSAGCARAKGHLLDPGITRLPRALTCTAGMTVVEGPAAHPHTTTAPVRCTLPLRWRRPAHLTLPTTRTPSSRREPDRATPPSDSGIQCTRTTPVGQPAPVPDYRHPGGNRPARGTRLTPGSSTPCTGTSELAPERGYSHGSRAAVSHPTKASTPVGVGGGLLRPVDVPG
jgi:hypothetical protein